MSYYSVRIHSTLQRFVSRSRKGTLVRESSGGIIAFLFIEETFECGVAEGDDTVLVVSCCIHGMLRIVGACGQKLMISWYACEYDHCAPTRFQPS